MSNTHCYAHSVTFQACMLMWTSAYDQCWGGTGGCVGVVAATLNCCVLSLWWGVHRGRRWLVRGTSSVVVSDGSVVLPSKSLPCGPSEQLSDVRCVDPVRLPFLGGCGQNYLEGSQRTSGCDGDSPQPKATGGGFDHTCFGEWRCHNSNDIHRYNS